MSKTKGLAKRLCPPYPTVCICSEGVKQKRRTRRAEGEGAVGRRETRRGSSLEHDQRACESKPARPVMNEATAERRTGLRCLRFFVGESVKTAKSQTFLNSPRRLGAPRQRVLRRGSRLRPKHIQTRRSARKPLKRLAIADASRHAHGSNHSAISGSSVTSRIIVSIMS